LGRQYGWSFGFLCRKEVSPALCLTGNENGFADPSRAPFTQW
jgi:hypothetical protein